MTRAAALTASALAAWTASASTTVAGGTCDPGGCGTVFKIALDGAETLLHAFQGDMDGEASDAGLIADSAGNLYGTTFFGGEGSTTCDCGTVFRITPDGTESVLYAFKGGTDGAHPEASLVMDKSGTLYGTTTIGGNIRCSNHQGCGTVFELTHGGKEKVLYVFPESHGQFPHGENPATGLLIGNHGTVYGTTTAGGEKNDGVVFSIKD